MRARIPALILLFAFLALTAYSPSPAASQAQDKPKDKEKEKEKDPNKPQEFKWPTQIGGKGVKDWLKDATENPDPAIREFALKTLPNFGPSARKECSKALLHQMKVEIDPGVRLTVYTIVGTLGVEDAELKDTITHLANVVDNGLAGGMSRLRAIQTLAMFGPKAEGAVGKLTGVACSDPAYETRRTLASTLAQVGFNEKSGPNILALKKLAGTFSHDKSAAVRMEALQSLVLLGPPWADKSPGKGVPGPINWKAAGDVAVEMRKRLVVTKTRGIVEQDKQLEIWCRVVLMRFDQKELDTEEHLNAIVKNLDDTSELGPKLQALQALALFGERAGTQVDKVVPLLTNEDPVIMTGVLTTLAAMGVKGEPALDKLEKTEKFWAEKREKRQKDEDFRKVVANLKPEEIKRVIESLNEEQMRLAVANTIKFIKDSKPGKPGGDMAAAAPPGPGDKKP